MELTDRNRSQRRRLQFREVLLDILVACGQESPHLYFEPPASIQMQYPAIRYNRNRIMNTSADNTIYKQDDEYTVTVIDLDPDSEIARAVSRIPKARFDRSYVQNNLHHSVFTILEK